MKRKTPTTHPHRLPLRKRAATQALVLAPQTRAQHGAVIPYFLIALLPMLAMIGLALDMGHLYWTRTRMQNSVDAAAIRAARTLETVGNTTLLLGNSVAGGYNAFVDNQVAAGNAELLTDSAGNNPSDDLLTSGIEFSFNLPFTPTGGNGSRFAKVTQPAFQRPYWLLYILQLIDPSFASTTINTGALSALAGPSPTLKCPANVTPLIACDGNVSSAMFPKAATTTGGIPDSVILQGAGDVQDGNKTSTLCIDDSNVSVTSMSNTELKKQLVNRRNGDAILNQTSRSYTNYKATMITNNGNTDETGYTRIMTLPLVHCTSMTIPSGSKVKITGFGCFYLITGTGTTCDYNNLNPVVPVAPGSTIGCLYPIPQSTGCINQGEAIQEGTTVGAGPHTFILYKE